MIYRKLIIENFGAYYGRQELVFGKDRGVWVVYGDNGRGKTTLLNAFRYVLYGKVLGRRAERRPEELANTRHHEEVGRKEFKVILEFDHDGVGHRATRHYRQGHQPEHTLVVEREGTPLSDEDAARTMVSVAPESISQFFLFDGELLRQYEDLRDPDADSGRQMRDEVDRLLGVHALKHAVSDLREVSAEISREKAKVLAANAKAENLAQAMQEATDKRAALVSALSELEAKRRSHQARLAEVTDALAEHERAQAVLGRLDGLRNQRTQLEVKKVEAAAALDDLTSDAWQAALVPAIGSRLGQLKERIKNLDERRVESIVAHRMVHRLDADAQCPVCDTALNENQRSSARQRALTKAQEDPSELDRAVAGLRSQEDVLNHLQLSADPALLAERERVLASLELELGDLGDDIEELEVQLRDIDETEVRRYTRERDNLTVLINEDARAIEGTGADIAEQEHSVTRIKAELARLDVRTDPVLEKRDELSTQMLSLFGAALTKYQDDVLKSVEDQASKLFMSIRSEQEYARLRIQEGYGLTIVDEKGREVTGHSAGYEHLVALALIGALQRSSPVQGPIVMDSPFGRLDEAHTRNVVAALPQIADQVVLLAFEGEFDRESALEALGGSLVAESHLERVSSTHTRISPGAPS